MIRDVQVKKQVFGCPPLLVGTKSLHLTLLIFATGYVMAMVRDDFMLNRQQTISNRYADSTMAIINTDHGSKNVWPQLIFYIVYLTNRLHYGDVD